MTSSALETLKNSEQLKTVHACCVPNL